jgi:hypothetical protein
MAFAQQPADPARLARIEFGRDWSALSDPADRPECDPMEVSVRLGLYRLLVEQTNRHGGFGRHHEASPFWGYASQLAWQHRSGRLGSAPGVIAADSWWGACNYALSVVPYAAAMELGVVPRLDLTVADRYAAVLPAWRAAMVAMTSGPRIDLDGVRVSVWRAHLASIRLAVAAHRAEYAAMPAPERRFARGWVRMVDLFAAAALRTDLDKLVETGGGTLPSRILSDAVQADLARHERNTVRRVGALADRPDWLWAIELALWRRIMRTRAARADGETLLTVLFSARGDRVRAVALAGAYAVLPARAVDAILG